MLLARRHALAVVGALASAALPTGVRADDEPLRVVAFPIDSSAEPYYALEQGFFKAAGLNVTLETGANGPAVAAGVVSGAIDIGLGNIVSLAQARARGVAFIAVAPAADYAANAPTTLMVVPRESEARRGRDLAGKTVAMSTLNGLPHYATRLWIDKDGGDSSGTKFVEMSFQDMIVAISRNRVDAALVTEPFLGPARAGGRLLGAPFDAIGRPFPVAIYFATPVWAQAHGGTVKKFAEALARTAVWANREHARSAEILMKYANMDREVVRTMTRAVYADRIDPAAVQALLDLAARYGGIPAFKADEFLVAAR